MKKKKKPLPKLPEEHYQQQQQQQQQNFPYPDGHLQSSASETIYNPSLQNIKNNDYQTYSFLYSKLAHVVTLENLDSSIDAVMLHDHFTVFGNIIFTNIFQDIYGQSLQRG